MTIIEVPRRTVARSVQLRGLGLHSGIPVEVVLSPAEDGIRFLRGEDYVVAAPESVADTTRSTSLGIASTVEHLMSALGGLGITDLDVRLSGPEVPAMDGSAAPFCDALDNAGRIDLGFREFRVPEGGLAFTDGPVRIEISPGSGKWQYQYESHDLWPHQRVVHIDLGLHGYRQSVARARTFLRVADLDTLEERGLARGLDRDTILIVGPDGYMTPTRIPDELVVHKLLDLMGDLFLTGIPPVFLDVTARRSGHRTNTKAALSLDSATTVRNVPEPSG